MSTYPDIEKVRRCQSSGMKFMADPSTRAMIEGRAKKPKICSNRKEKDKIKAKNLRAQVQGDQSSENGEKRLRRLRLNRVAAEGFRNKQKIHENQLQERADTLKLENSQLHHSVMRLQNELISLKSECLRCGDCEAGCIRDYFRRVADFESHVESLVATEDLGPDEWYYKSVENNIYMTGSGSI